MIADESAVGAVIKQTKEYNVTNITKRRAEAINILVQLGIQHLDIGATDGARSNEIDRRGLGLTREEFATIPGRLPLREL